MRKTLDPYSYGLEGEEIASKHLRELGFEILFTRYKTRHGEIDLVAKKDDLLIFVEVKSRNSPMHMDLLSDSQIKRNCNAALCFIAENPHYTEYQMRFDFISVIDSEIREHIENAWSYEVF